MMPEDRTGGDRGHVAVAAAADAAAAAEVVAENVIRVQWVRRAHGACRTRHREGPFAIGVTCHERRGVVTDLVS